MRRETRKRLLTLLMALAILSGASACGAAESTGDSSSEETQNTVDGGQKSDLDGTVETPVELPEGERELGETQSADGSTAVIVDREELLPDGAETLPEVGQRPANPAQRPESGSRPADLNQEPVGKPVEKPAETTPQTPPAQQEHVDLTAFYNAMASGAEWPAMAEAEEEVINALYPGLNELSTEQCGIYMTMMSAAVGEIALVEVSDSSDAQAVKDIFQARIDEQVGDDKNPGGAWYPASIEGWKNNSRIVSNDSYVMLIVMEGADDIVAGFHALFA